MSSPCPHGCGIEHRGGPSESNCPNFPSSSAGESGGGGVKKPSAKDSQNPMSDFASQDSEAKTMNEFVRHPQVLAIDFIDDNHVIIETIDDEKIEVERVSDGVTQVTATDHKGNSETIEGDSEEAHNMVHEILKEKNEAARFGSEDSSFMDPLWMKSAMMRGLRDKSEPSATRGVFGAILNPLVKWFRFLFPG